jgi:hypothetical protein
MARQRCAILTSDSGERLEGPDAAGKTKKEELLWRINKNKQPSQTIQERQSEINHVTRSKQATKRTRQKKKKKKKKKKKTKKRKEI